MTESEKKSKPPRTRRLLLVLMILAALWGGVTAARMMMPPAPLPLARAAVEVGHFDVAVAHYRRYLEKRPDDWGVQLEMGVVLSDFNRPQALAELRKIPAGTESHVEACNQIAQLCMVSGRFQEAEEALLTLAEASPDDWGPQFTLASFYFQQKSAAKALPYARRSSELNPDDPQSHFLLAELLDDLQRSSEMIAPLQKVIDIELDNYAAHLNLSYAYSEAGQAERCQEEAEWCLARNPNDVHAYRFVAQAQRDQGQREAAMETIRQALTLDPYDLECRLVEAELLLFERRADEAFDNLEPLCESHQNDRRLAALLARAAAAAGRADEAEKYRQQVEKLSQ
jgi:superkiller protein 3